MALRWGGIFNVKEMNMSNVITPTKEAPLGVQARRLRIALHLSPREAAEKAGVTVEALDLFEHNLPVALDVRRRILRELWAIKTGNDARGAISRV
jgi:hypothetical protein